MNTVAILNTFFSDGTETPTHGTGGPDTRTYSFKLEEFGDDARIIGVVLRSGGYIDQIAFVFKSTLTELPFGIIGPYGGSGGESGVVIATGFHGLYGRSGDGINQLGFYGELYE